MSREEEIIEAGIEYTMKNRPNVLAGDKFSEEMREFNRNKTFEEGAKWADEHPSVDTVKKIICYALRFTNIMLVDDLEKGIEWESLIKKTMEDNV